VSGGSSMSGKYLVRADDFVASYSLERVERLGSIRLVESNISELSRIHSNDLP
jgi:hypothetical protein